VREKGFPKIFWRRKFHSDNGIAVGNVNDFGVEVSGEGYAGEKNP